MIDFLIIILFAWFIIWYWDILSVTLNEFWFYVFFGSLVGLHAIALYFAILPKSNNSFPWFQTHTTVTFKFPLVELTLVSLYFSLKHVHDTFTLDETLIPESSIDNLIEDKKSSQTMSLALVEMALVVDILLVLAGTFALFQSIDDLSFEFDLFELVLADCWYYLVGGSDLNWLFGWILLLCGKRCLQRLHGVHFGNQFAFFQF